MKGAIIKTPMTMNKINCDRKTIARSAGVNSRSGGFLG